MNMKFLVAIHSTYYLCWVYFRVKCIFLYLFFKLIPEYLKFNRGNNKAYSYLIVKR